MTARQHIRALVALAMLALAGASPLRAQEQGLYQVRVDSIVVSGVKRYSEESVRRIARLRIGDIVNGPDIQESIQRLFATGEFSDIEVSVTPDSPAVFFVRVVERPVVGQFHFEGLEHANAGAIRDSAGLVAGTALDPSRIARALVLIRSDLANAGFPQAVVDTAMTADPSGLDQFDVTFRVDEGPRLALVRVDFVDNNALTTRDLRSQMSTVEEGFFWFRPGELHEDEYRRDLAERLPAFYGSMGYIDMSVLGDTILVDRSTGKGRIEIRVVEGEQYHLRSLQVDGNSRFPTSQLSAYYKPAREGLLDENGQPVGELQPFDMTGFEEATQNINDLYRDAGYLRAQIIPNVARNPADSLHAFPTVDVAWLIREGPPAYIRSVQIAGNDFTHDRVIRKILLTLPGDIYSQQLLISSIRNIQSLGFFETLPPDQAIEINPREDGDIDIVYRVKEKQTGN
ncbi:MAG: hypothetical protein E4H28_04475, partial [Gemmatimonadales bacterium]